MTKITKAMKEELMRLVNERVTLNDLKQKLDDTLEVVTQHLEKLVSIPDSDWEVLSKYNKATLRKEWIIKDTTDNTPSRLVWNSYYKDYRPSSGALVLNRGVRAPSYDYVEETDPIVDNELFFRVSKYYADLDVYHLKLKELKDSYNKLIQTSPTFEALCEVWPEAKEIESRTIVTKRGKKIDESLAQIIKEDVAKRSSGDAN